MNQRLLGFIRKSRSDALRRLGQLGNPSIGAPATVARIDDPDGRCTMLAVRGLVDAHTLDALWIEADQVRSTMSVHLDLTDATILPGPWMGELEVFADALEDAGCSVGIAGLNPHHPELWRDRPLDPPR
jgi:hypothetical protein